MALEEINSPAQETWNGPFLPESYVTAREILEADHQRVSNEIKAVRKRRACIVGGVAAVWVVCSVALALVNPELMLVAEIGWIVIIAFAVFWMIPAIVATSNAEELFAQYESRLGKLEAAGTPLPEPSCMEDLVAALDLVSLPEE